MMKTPRPEAPQMARAPEGMPRHASTHAAGVVISKEPVDEYVPMYLSDKGPGYPVYHDHHRGAGTSQDGLFRAQKSNGHKRRIGTDQRNHGGEIDFARMAMMIRGVYEMISGQYSGSVPA